MNEESSFVSVANGRGVSRPIPEDEFPAWKEEFLAMAEAEFEEEFTDTYVDGYIALQPRSGIEDELAGTKINMAYIYRDEFLHQLAYVGRGGSYNQKLGDDVIGDFAFKDD